MTKKKPKPINHGTYSGYQQELRRRINICDECRDAKNAYHKQNRANEPPHYSRTRTRETARSRAMRRLAELHPEDMERLFDDELRAAGLT